MGTDLNANILGVKRAKDLTDVTGNLNSIYSQSKAEQKNALSQLFKQKYFNSTTEKATIDTQIETLEAKIKDFQDKIGDLEDQISEKEEELNKLKSDLSDKVAKIVADTEEYEEASKKMVDTSIENALKQYKENSSSKRNGGHKSLTDFINIELTGANTIIQEGRKGIDDAIRELSTPQSQLNSIIGEMEGLVGDIDSLDSQYGTTKSTLELLKMTRNNMTDAAGSYQTSDTDPSVPIFTPAKEDLADGYLGKYTSRMADREAQEPSVIEENKNAVLEKYQAMVAEPTPGADPYKLDNAQLVSFSEALNAGMLNDMSEAGFTKKEMLESINQLFPSIGISHGDDGRPIVPWGHGADAQAVFTQFIETFSATEGPNQRDDLQVAEMDKAVRNDKIITEMKNNDFTWKETAYTLTKLWPAGGIEYTLGEKEVTLPIGDEQSKGTFDILEEEIKKNYPDVVVNRGTNPNGDGDGDGTDLPPDRTDPVGFHIGDNSYEFAIDRNQDGVLNDFTEMVGANGVDGMEEMALFDTNGDGHINGDELKNILVLNTEHTNRDYEFLTAEQLDIKDIDLSSFAEKTQSRGEGVEGTEDFININDSLITGTFNITLNNGEKAEGYQKYVTDEYMQTVYNPILGENIYSELDGDTVDNVIDDAFKEADNELGDLNEIKDVINETKKYSDIKAALRTKLDAAQNEAYGYKSKAISEYIVNHQNTDTENELEMPLEQANETINHYLDIAEQNANKKTQEELEEKKKK